MTSDSLNSSIFEFSSSVLFSVLESEFSFSLLVFVLFPSFDCSDSSSESTSFVFPSSLVTSVLSSISFDSAEFVSLFVPHAASPNITPIVIRMVIIFFITIFILFFCFFSIYYFFLIFFYFFFFFFISFFFFIFFFFFFLFFFFFFILIIKKNIFILIKK